MASSRICIINEGVGTKPEKGLRSSFYQRIVEADQHKSGWRKEAQESKEEKQGKERKRWVV
jgi:hypothetical protein